MNSASRLVVFAWIVVASIVVAGCAQTSSEPTVKHDDENQGEHDHDSHDHQESLTFAAALQEADQLREGIKTAFADNDMEKADGPVHRMGFLLHHLPDLATKASLSESDQQQVQLAVDALTDCFGAVDERLHGGESAGKSYDEVATQVDEQFEELKAIKLPESHP